MSRSVQLNLPPQLVQVSSPTRETAAPSTGHELSLTRLLADCVADSGCSEKDAALSQGYEPNYWSRIKTGEKAAHLERISRLPEKVQREFVSRWAQQLKMRVIDENSQQRAITALAKAALDVLSEIA